MVAEKRGEVQRHPVVRAVLPMAAASASSNRSARSTSPAAGASNRSRRAARHPQVRDVPAPVIHGGEDRADPGVGLRVDERRIGSQQGLDAIEIAGRDRVEQQRCRHRAVL